MAIEYLFCLFLLMWLSFYQFYVDPLKARIPYFYTLAVILLALVGGLRYRVGPDWPGYESVFYAIQNSSLDDIEKIILGSGFEKGYVLFNYLVAFFNTEIWLLQLVLLATSLYLKTSTLYRHTHFSYLALLLYFMPLFFFEDIIQIRQGFATGVCVFAVNYIVDKKPWKFLLCCLIAYQFHRTSIIFFPAYILANLKIDYYLSCFIVGVTMLLSPLGLSTYLGEIISILPVDAVENGYEAYVGTSYTESTEFSFNDVVKIATFFVMMLYNETTCREVPHYPIFRDLYLFSLFLYYFFRMEAIFSIRLPGYYGFYFAFVLPQIVFALFPKRTDFNIVAFVVLLYVFLLYFRFSDLQSAYFSEYPNFLYRKADP